MAALERPHPVTQRLRLAWFQEQRLRQVSEAQAIRHMIEQFQGQRLGKVVANLQAHFAPAAQGQAAGQLAPEQGRRQAPEPEGVQHGQQQQGQEQAPGNRLQAGGDLQAVGARGAEQHVQRQQYAKPGQKQACGFHRFSGLAVMKLIVMKLKVTKLIVAVPALDRAVA